MWRPPEDSPQRQIWLLIHPAITDVLVKEISNNIKELLTSESVIVTDLHDELAHYKLMGAHCNDVIVQTIDPVWSVTGGQCDKEKEQWWMTRQSTSGDGLTDKKKFFEYFFHAKAPAELPNKTIVGLIVKDFRLSMRDTRVNITPLTHIAPPSITKDPGIETPQCHIWEKAVRECVKQNQVPEHQLNKIRSERLLDVNEKLNELECYVPLLLLHQTVNGVGVGWDILVPAGWGKHLWLSLVYHGARAIGFEEMKQYHLEQMLLHYPTDFPDTNGGQQLELNNYELLQSKYSKYPPDKRPNFGKLNSPSPFMPLWRSLISHYNSELVVNHQDNATMLPASKKAKLSNEGFSIEEGESSYYVLRSVKHLVSLSKLLDSLKATKEVTSEESWLTLLNNMQLSSITTEHSKSLVAIFFAMCHRGNPSARSMMCIPSVEDLVKLSSDKSYCGPVELLNKKGVCFKHNEKLLIGTTSLTNKEFKLAKKELLKVSKSQPTKAVNSDVNDDRTAALDLQPLLPSRLIIGYATNAGYQLSQGAGSGVAFCSLLGLMELMKFCYLQHHPVTVLVREHDSQQYRFADINVVQNHF